MVLLTIYICLSIGVSFVCSVLEAVLLSITPSYLAQMKKDGHAATERLHTLKANIDRPLASILTLNTIAHTIGAAGAGAQASNVFGSQWLGVFSAVLTLGILLLSEIIPKTIGATYWRQLAPMTAIVLKWMVWMLTPFVWVSEQITKRFASAHSQPKLRDELSAMALMAKESSEFAEGESTLLNNVLSHQETPISTVMTPRRVVFRVDQSMTAEEFLNTHTDIPFSRPLIYSGQRDNIVGFVHRLDLLKMLQEGRGKESLETAQRPIHVLFEAVTIPKAFEYLLKHKLHLIMVVDEYGDVQGIVTLEDIFEHLIGEEIVDEADLSEDMQVHAQKKYEDWKQSNNVIENYD